MRRLVDEARLRRFMVALGDEVERDVRRHGGPPRLAREVVAQVNGTERIR
jgi:hypothetical protein